MTTPCLQKTVIHLLSCCLTSTEARWPIRDGDRVGRGRESERLDRGNRPKKTGETVDRRQNNGSVKAVSPRHCPATCALRNCYFNCCAGQSLRQCPLHRCWRTTWTTRSKRRPTCSAQLHLSTHDLFWANVRVQLHLPPLRSFDLAWNPVCRSYAPTEVCFCSVSEPRFTEHESRHGTTAVASDKTYIPCLAFQTGVADEFSSPGSTFCADSRLIVKSVPPAVVPQ